MLREEARRGWGGREEEGRPTVRRERSGERRAIGEGRGRAERVNIERRGEKKRSDKERIEKRKKRKEKGKEKRKEREKKEM